MSDNITPLRDPWSDPRSYKPEKISTDEWLRRAGYRKTLFERFCDGSADLIADLVERPGLAFVSACCGAAVGMLMTAGLAYIVSFWL